MASADEDRRDAVAKVQEWKMQLVSAKFKREINATATTPVPPPTWENGSAGLCPCCRGRNVDDDSADDGRNVDDDSADDVQSSSIAGILLHLDTICRPDIFSWYRWCRGRTDDDANTDTVGSAMAAVDGDSDTDDDSTDSTEAVTDDDTDDENDDDGTAAAVIEDAPGEDAAVDEATGTVGEAASRLDFGSVHFYVVRVASTIASFVEDSLFQASAPPTDMKPAFSVVWDSGASLCVSPCKEDFVGPLNDPPANPTNGVSGPVQVAGSGYVS